MYESIFRPGLFEGRTIVVTGGGTGIGRAVAATLVARGGRVAILGRRPRCWRRPPASWAAPGDRPT